MHGESFGPQAAPQMQEPLAALTAALDTRTHGAIPGMVGENFGGGHGGAPDTRTHGPIPGMMGEHGAGGGLGLALGDWAHLPAPPPPGGGIHWFGPGGSGIAYPTPNGGGPEVFGAGPIGSHGQVYTEPIRRRPALAHALQVS
jgi:hypothetical protein